MTSLSPTVNGHKTESSAGSDPDQTISLAIADDDENDRRLLIQGLEKLGEFVVVGGYRSGYEALAEIPNVRPHVVLMDIRMPGMDGIECARRLRMLMPELVVIFVTGLQEASTLRQASQAGGDDYLVKPLVIAQCMATIRFALGRCRVSNARTQTGSARGLPLLTEREMDVLDGLATGLLYKEIANKLHTTAAMVHKLQHSLYSKLQVGNRSEAIAILYRKERPD